MLTPLHVIVTVTAAIWAGNVFPLGQTGFCSGCPVNVLSCQQRSPAPVLTLSGETSGFSRTDGWVTLARAK